MLEFGLPALAVLLGYVVLGITGFGSSLVIVPLLTWIWPLPEVVALTLLLDLPACVMHGGLNLRQVRWDEVRRMVPGMLLGSLLGLWLVHILEPRWPLFFLGLYIAAVGVKLLRRPALAHARLPAHASTAAGALAGTVETMFGTAGPVLVAWLRWRLPDPLQMRATAPALIACSASIVIAGLGATGRLSSSELWWRWLLMAGFALAGVMLGDRLARHVPAPVLLRWIACLLIVSGLLLTKNALAP